MKFSYSLVKQLLPKSAGKDIGVKAEFIFVRGGIGERRYA